MMPKPTGPLTATCSNGLRRPNASSLTLDWQQTKRFKTLLDGTLLSELDFCSDEVRCSTIVMDETHDNLMSITCDRCGGSISVMYYNLRFQCGDKCGGKMAWDVTGVYATNAAGGEALPPSMYIFIY